MSSHQNVVANELAQVPALANHWVAIEPAGTAPAANSNSTWGRRRAPTSPLLRLATGDAVVDADANLDELCARLNATHQTSLTIVFVA